MQFEYDWQPQKTTARWREILRINEGDYIFLRGDDKIHAVGRVTVPRKKADIELTARDIINNKSHNVSGVNYVSGTYQGCIHFEDSDVFYEDLSDIPPFVKRNGEWGQRVDVDNWKYYSQTGISSNENDYTRKDTQFIIRELKEDKAKEIIAKLENKFMEDVTLLKENKNLVLTGAPGTGKTYLAKQMAVKLLFNKPEERLLDPAEKESFKEQFELVQFHPSYDYTDFVEGLRPTPKTATTLGSTTSGGTTDIGFELKDGLFKSFCKKAIGKCVYDTTAENEEIYNEEKSEKFVFVIDEINRGEISKIFGELFFSIDPGYRGKKGAVKTQYSNMESEPNEFDKVLGIKLGDNNNYGHFYIPENVYIVGTMNDIDRSVESFDFAMRRRFVWKEIKAEDSVTPDRMDLLNDTKNRMINLNNAISIIEGLNSSYHIGGAYFLDKKTRKSVDLGIDTERNDLWSFRLKPLLAEYLRGNSDVENTLKNLKEILDQSGTTILDDARIKEIMEKK
jgi:5-methylcytosine-specific restriction endonuclease McrBC GTP-binding regulatory subunit McrB